MSVVIRLKRMGTNNRPFFRVVVTEKGFPRDGRFIEELGHYDPIKKDENFNLDVDRTQYWISKGAKPSFTVKSMLKKASKKK